MSSSMVTADYLTQKDPYQESSGVRFITSAEAASPPAALVAALGMQYIVGSPPYTFYRSDGQTLVQIASGGALVNSYAGLSDKTTVDLTTINTPLASALSTITANIAAIAANYVNTSDVNTLIAAYIAANGGTVTDHVAQGNPHTQYLLISNASETIDDRVAALFVAGTLITLTYNDPANTFTVAVSDVATGSMLGRVAASTGPAKALTYNEQRQLLNKTQTLTYAATVTPDCDAGLTMRLVLTGNVTLANPTNLVNGDAINLRILQDATGSRLLSAVGSKWKFPGGTVPTLTTTANAVDFICGVYDSTDDTITAVCNKAFA